MADLSPKKNAVFGLVRGYAFWSKWKYVQLIFRNWALSIWKARARFDGDFLLFHEGNIKPIDQFLIRVLSFLPVQFVNVAEAWKLSETDVWEGTSDFPQSYSLMCKFNYIDLWEYLHRYDVVCRVDEDCIVLNLPDFHDVKLFDTGALFQESHPRTNSTMPNFLETLGLESFYDHAFPYTNLYLTRVSFWRTKEVSQFLNSVREYPYSLEYRWGDIPVLGVALKAFGKWDASAAVNSEIEYFHLSHLTKVAQGKKADIRTKDVWE